MLKPHSSLTFSVACGLVVACRPPNTAPEASDASGVAVTCTSKSNAGVCSGTFIPTQLDSAVEPVKGMSGGIGVHFFCFPQDEARWNGKLLIHLVGTGDIPTLTNGFPERACELGFASISPMYKNDNDARSTCGRDTDCYERMRQEVVYGNDVAPLPIQVNSANSVAHRLETILTRLANGSTAAAKWTALREAFIARDFSRILVSGHSQGSGHALLLARDFSVARLVMIGGLTDRLDSGKASNVSVKWVTDWKRNSKTPSSRVYGYNHQDDAIATYAQVLSNYDSLGVSPSACAFSDAGNYPAECHRFFGLAAGCSPFNAHVSLVARKFGGPSDACQLGGPQHTNAATWAFLLAVDLP